MTTQSQSPTQPPAALILALRRILSPLVRLMLAHGITYQFASEILKQSLVESVDQEFRLKGEPTSDSRISLLSGIHRKDVKRLRQPLADDIDIPPSVSMGSRLVALWLSKAPFVDENDQPRPLPRLRSAGGDTSFENLARQVSTDIRSRVILDELLRTEVVHMDEEDRVCLKTEAFLPKDGQDEQMYYLGHGIGDHLKAASLNILGTTPPYLERVVHYEQLTPDAVETLRALAEKSGMQALKAVNRKAMEETQRKPEQGQPLQRMSFGIYFYHEPSQARDKDTE